MSDDTAHVSRGNVSQVPGPRQSRDRQYFWQRGPGWLNRLLLGSVIAAATLAGLVGSLAAVAQSVASDGTAGAFYSLPMHMLAMTSVAALAVAVAGGLHALRRTELAALVLVGAAFGPMTLVAVPVRESLIDTSTYSNTVLWWQLAVGSVMTAVLAAWTWWVARCLRESAGMARHPDERREFAWLWPDITFLVAAGVGYLVYAQAPVQANEPFTRAMVGWVTVAAGILVVAAFWPRAWAAVALLAGVAVTLGVIVAAYSRDGGWPGVAGWEVGGMQSPIITAWAVTAILLAAPAVGFALRGLLGAARRATSARVRGAERTAIASAH